MRRNWIKMLKESRNCWQTLATYYLFFEFAKKKCLPKFAKVRLTSPLYNIESIYQVTCVTNCIYVRVAGHSMTGWGNTCGLSQTPEPKLQK